MTDFEVLIAKKKVDVDEDLHVVEIMQTELAQELEAFVQNKQRIHFQAAALANSDLGERFCT